MAEPLFLGFDLSTQQLKAAVITKDSKVVYEQSIHFDNDLPHHGTTSGAIKGTIPGEITCPVIVWVEAVDALIDQLKKSGKVDIKQIVAVSGAAQVRRSFNSLASCS